jgi:hypothetical protein
LLHIATQEGISPIPDLDHLIFTSNGDMRQCIVKLQLGITPEPPTTYDLHNKDIGAMFEYNEAQGASPLFRQRMMDFEKTQ